MRSTSGKSKRRTVERIGEGAHKKGDKEEEDRREGSGEGKTNYDEGGARSEWKKG